MMSTLRTAFFSLALVLISTAALAASNVYELQVDGLACPFCAYGIEKKLSAVEGVRRVDIDIATGMVVVTMADGAALDEVTAGKAVEAAGFSLRGFAEVEATARNQPDK